MRPNVEIRDYHHPLDYESILHLWEEMNPWVKVGCSDAREEIEKKIKRDPDLFLVAEVDGQIVGTVMGGFDGRRGMIYHLAIRQDMRARGIASRLMTEVEKRLQEKGCVKCYLLVFADNLEAIRFYESRGWREMREDRIFGKEF